MSYYFYKNLEMNPVNSKHIPMLIEHRNHIETWENLTYILPLFFEGQLKWVESVNSDKTKLYFVVNKLQQEAENIASSESIGMIRIDEIDYINRSCRVGCDVFISHRRHSYSSVIMKMVCEFCFKELNMNRLWLLVLENNVKAISSYKKVGFKKEGVQRKAIFRHGDFRDYLMFSMLRKEYK